MKKVAYKTMVQKLASTRASLYLSGSNEGIGTEIAWTHGITSRPVGLAPDSNLIAAGMSAFKSQTDLIRGRDPLPPQVFRANLGEAPRSASA